MSWIQTYTGRKFYPLAPRAEDIDFKDIAHALSMLCRFGGHCRYFYSVAEHSWHLSYAVAPEFALWALLHDASEAYLVDVPRPIKSALPGYKDAEHRLERKIAARFGLTCPMPAEVKAADDAILTNEAISLMVEPPEEWSNVKPPLPGVVLRYWEPKMAKFMFTARFDELMQTASA